MNKLMAISNRLDNFIIKAYKENQPLNLVRNDSDFEKFKQDMAAAILGQAMWTAAQLNTLSEEYIARDLGSMTQAQQNALAVYLSNNMPRLTTFISIEAVEKWYQRSFTAGAKSVYRANNLDVNFSLKNSNYLQSIRDSADYLLNQSSLDDTTRNGLIKLIADDREAGMTRAEISQDIQDSFDEISATRADMIADTETAGMLNRGQYAAMKESGVMQKAWLALGNDPCDIICLPNSGDDYIPIDSMFGSGDLMPPGHPRCECSLDYMNLDITEIDAWSGE